MGMRFERAHVTIAVCQPCRSVLMTGRYPHHNGARGFQPITKGVPTLTGVLRRAGYFNGIIGKTVTGENYPDFDFKKKLDSNRRVRRSPEFQSFLMPSLSVTKPPCLILIQPAKTLPIRLPCRPHL